MERVVKIKKQGLSLQAWVDETGASIVVNCIGGGGGLIVVPVALRSKLVDSLESLVQEFRQWDEGEG